MQKIKIRIIKITSELTIKILNAPFSIHGDLIDEAIGDISNSAIFAFNRKAIYY